VSHRVDAFRILLELRSLFLLIVCGQVVDNVDRVARVLLFI
jgi:hypothetical protein